MQLLLAARRLVVTGAVAWAMLFLHDVVRGQAPAEPTLEQPAVAAEADEDHEHRLFDGLGWFNLHRPGHDHDDDDGHHHGHARHESLGGYPYLHPIRTEIDFVERSLEFQLVNVRADGGATRELEFETEIVWALNDRLTFLIGTPLVSRWPDGESFVQGFGDTKVGVRFLAYEGRQSLVFMGLDVIAPTGAARHELGDGFASLEPKVLWLYDFGGGTYTQTVVGWSTPTGENNEPSVLSYDIALCHALRGTGDWRFARWFTPIYEINGRSNLNGAESGATTLDMTVGLRWQMRREDECGIGWSFPVLSNRTFDHEILLNYFIHF